ncbi:hypothetical protein HPA05_05895 [Streptococcus suis]|nr:hypothetical protein [Streptococcus suis]
MRVALTRSDVVSTVILSTPALAELSEVTGILISEPTTPSSVPTTAAVLVPPVATTQLPAALTSKRVVVPSGMVILALVAPREMVTGTTVE